MKNNYNVTFKACLVLVIGLFFNGVAEAVPETESIPISRIADRIITGKVTADDGQAIPGVNVVVKGTTIGVVTDIDGNYSITVPDQATTLVFSFIGYNPQEVLVNNRSVIDITLEPDVKVLQEVVVVGYGTTSRANLTQSVGSVQGEALNERPTAINVLQGMAGKVAGVNVMTNSGKPGGAPAVRIRGTGTISGSSAPLYVIDGIVGADPTMIDPTIVESMDILKDASAAAIYGARGSNGVIIITTRKGARNSSQITFNNSVSFGTLPRKLDLLDAEGALEMIRLQYDYPYRADPNTPRYAPNHPNGVGFPRKDDLFNADGSPKYNTDWMDESTQTAISYNHSLTFSGGKDDLRVLANLSYRNQQGIVKNSYEKRLNGYLNLEWDVNSWLSLSALINSGASEGSNVDLNATGSTALRKMYEFLPFLPVKYEDGTYSRMGDFPGSEDSENPVRLLDEIKNTVGRSYTLANLTLRFHILPSLDFVTNAGAQTAGNYDYYYAGTQLRGVSLTQGGIARRMNSHSGGYTNENYLSYDNDFGKHNLQATLGASWYYHRASQTLAEAQNFFDDFYSYNSLQAGSVVRPTIVTPTGNQMNSFYGRVNYNYDNRYLFGASYRADGSSRFGPNNKYGFFPALSAGWNIANESFFSGLQDNISTLKLRVSYGEVGNAEIGDYRTQARLTNSLSTFNNQPTSVVVVGSMPNANLAWETSSQTNIGIDLAIFGGRIDITADWYNKVNSDLLYQRILPVTTGQRNVWDNIGDIRNRGIEIGIHTTNLKSTEFTWNTAFNFTRNRSKILDLNGDIRYEWISRYMEGRPMNEFYGFVREGIWGTDEAAEAAAFGARPGDHKWQDTNDNGVKDLDDRVPLGTAMPTFEANMVNTFSYKGFNLLIDLQSMYGNHIADLSRHLMQNVTTRVNSYEDILNAWTPENQNTIVPALRSAASGDTGGASEPADSYAVEDASFIRVRNIGLTYRINADWLQKILITNLSLGINVENAFLFTKYRGIDPEYTSFDAQLNQGVVFYQYPKPRTLAISLNANF